LLPFFVSCPCKLRFSSLTNIQGIKGARKRNCTADKIRVMSHVRHDMS
jgi:hypothetical protein